MLLMLTRSHVQGHCCTAPRACVSAQVLPEFVRAVVHMLDQVDLPTFKVDTVAVDAIFETRGGASWVALGQGSCKDSNGGLRTAAVFQCSDFFCAQGVWE